MATSGARLKATTPAAARRASRGAEWYRESTREVRRGGNDESGRGDAKETGDATVTSRA
jgi:hypothetical protein